VHRLRFHLDQNACLVLADCPQLHLGFRVFLQQYAALYSKPRHHALLGQDVLRQFVVVQMRDSVAVLKKEIDAIPSLKALNGVLCIEGSERIAEWQKEFSETDVEDVDDFLDEL
jgi:hypothetical protein